MLTNTGTAPVSTWKVLLTYDAPVALVGAPWRAAVNASGATLTASDNGADPVLAAGASVSFGMSLSYAGAKPALSSVSVDGQGCLVPEVFYVDPQSTAALWVKHNPADSRAADIQANLARQAEAKWFGDWSGDIATAVGTYVSAAAAVKQTPILVAYNIPGRDCGQYSAGGANSIAGYKQWIAAFAGAVGQRKAVVILEPDALGQLTCLSASGQDGRLDALRYAVAQFRQGAPNAYVYLDAGNSSWLSAEVAASRLVQAGVADARGFSLNVSNYKTDQASNAYGDAVNAALYRQQGYTRTYVVDTSRNGNGPLGAEWCDPPGRKIGVRPVEHLTGGQAEMQLWIKAPGNADGCAAAGLFVPDLAYKLIHGD